MRIFKNVWYLCGMAVLVFVLMLIAAVYVGVMEGAFGCNGGSVGAMIPVASMIIGLLIGVSLKFAPRHDSEVDEVEEIKKLNKS